MSRYRLTPTPTQETSLAQHCTHARYVWNLAVEQQSWWRRGRGNAPGYCTQAAQLTEARAEFGWLANGSQMVQQRALRDFAQTMANYFDGTHPKPSWRKDWAEKTSTSLARRFDVIRVEDQIKPTFTSQRCSACGHVAADSRKSQALFRCAACGYIGNADVNAARNIAAGHAVSARGRSPLGERKNREPQPLSLSA